MSSSKKSSTKSNSKEKIKIIKVISKPKNNSEKEHSKEKSNKEQTKDKSKEKLIKQTLSKSESEIERKKDYTKKLKSVFGHECFRERQFEIIDTVIHKKKDCLCIMSTGYGKSLCYQFPAVYTGKPAIVISPLISLMEDQKTNLEKIGVKACCYNSTLTSSERSDEKIKILKGEYSVIFLTPEFITKGHAQQIFSMLDDSIGISVVCIDESHCLSSYGNDFRPSYRDLTCLKDIFPEIPILALTGTATNKVENDIVTTLSMNKPVIIKSSYDRPNLYIVVRQKTKMKNDLLQHFTDKKETTIIYCQTRKDTEKIAEYLQSKKIKCDAYHAGLKNDDRYEIHHKFINNEITCIVATISFGMGIDKGNIRQIIHYGCPKDMESYYQEIGRAGRDGNPSQCYVYFSRGDFTLNKTFIEDIKNQKYKTHRQDMVKELEKYLYSSKCRRKLILKYFGENYTSKNEKCCDNCTIGNSEKQNTHNFGEYAYLLLNMINKLNLTYGTTILINILRGAKSKKIPEFILKSNFHGVGKTKTVEWWKCFIQLLINEAYLSEKKISRFASCLTINKKSIEWLENNKDEPTLNLEITSHMDMVDGEDNVIKKSTFDETYDMYTDGLSIKDIAVKRNLQSETIENHIIKLILEGRKFNFNNIDLTIQQYKTIINIISDDPINGNMDDLKLIKDLCPKGITYFQIKLAFQIFDADKGIEDKLKDE